MFALDPIQELTEEEKGKADGEADGAGRLHDACMDASLCCGPCFNAEIILLHIDVNQTYHVEAHSL